MLLERGADYKTAQWSDYRYYPSLAAAILFVILFVVLTAFHVFRVVRTKTWFFIPFVIGGFFEWIGYVGRAVTATESPNWALGPFVVQSLLLLLAPALFAASMYMMLGRIIILTNAEAHSIIRRTWLTKIFVTGDVICFLMQGAGGGIQATGKTNPSHVPLGEHVIIGGLIVQVVFFGLFIITSIIFHTMPWRSHMYTLYGTNTLIMIRSIFRVIEYAMGNNGFLLRHEVFLYIFDSLPMLAVMLAYVWKYPSEISELMRSATARGLEDDLEMPHRYGEQHYTETPPKPG